MKNIVRENRPCTAYLGSRFALVIAIITFTASAADDCANISCDCQSLASDTWVSMCKEQELSLQQQCKSTSLQETGYCSVYGPNASRITLSLESGETSKEQTNIIKLMGYKYTAVLWSMNKDLEFISNSMDTNEFNAIEQRLRLLEQNAELHFGTQKQLVQALNETNNRLSAMRTWLGYASDTESITSQLMALSNRLRTGTKHASKKKAKTAKQLGYEILNAAGGLYEQVGYAYAQAKRYNESAQAWKQAAAIASELLQAETATQGDSERAEFFRYLAATRFHRASQNWTQGKEKQQAKEAMKQSREYMGTPQPASSKAQ